jgi:hypothetical protein
MSAIKLSTPSSGSISLSPANTASNLTITVPAIEDTMVTRTTNVVSGTAVASTSGTSIDFTGIPSWVKRITVMFNGVSTNGGSNCLVQLGTSSGVVSTGYSSYANTFNAIPSGTTTTQGILIQENLSSSTTLFGNFAITLITGNTWTASGTLGDVGGTAISLFGGSVALSGTLDRIRITTANGTDTFDAGSINILYE